MRGWGQGAKPPGQQTGAVAKVPLGEGRVQTRGTFEQDPDFCSPLLPPSPLDSRYLWGLGANLTDRGSNHPVPPLVPPQFPELPLAVPLRVNSACSPFAVLDRFQPHADGLSCPVLSFLLLACSLLP